MLLLLLLLLLVLVLDSLAFRLFPGSLVCALLIVYILVLFLLTAGQISLRSCSTATRAP